MRNSAARANVDRDGEEKQRVQKDTWWSEDEELLLPPLIINFNDRYRASQPFPPLFNHRNTQFDKPRQFLQPPEPPPPPPSPNPFSYNITPPPPSPNPFNVTSPPASPNPFNVTSPPASPNPFSFNTNQPTPFSNVSNPPQPPAFYHPPMIIPPQVVYHPPMVIPADTPATVPDALPAGNSAVADNLTFDTDGIDYGGDADQLAEALLEAMTHRREAMNRRQRGLIAQESGRIYRTPRVRKVRGRRGEGGEDEMVDVIGKAATRGRRERVKKKRKRGVHREVTPGSRPEVISEGDESAVDWWPGNSMDLCEEHPQIVQFEQQRQPQRQKLGL
ncbi:hypothetical protein K440DRAFT_664076 [Wilcoxina mikolae CBS 423.85]|nr:hypothetical protein K440DRAFT_664076 [Wilcoxina mikolae CBS 423.85]